MVKKVQKKSSSAKKNSKKKIIIIISLVIVGILLVLGFMPYSPYHEPTAEERKAVEQIVKPYDGSRPTSYPYEKEMSGEYHLAKIMDCYLTNEENTKLPEYETISKMAKKGVDWLTFDIGKNGYYEDDKCFAAYISPSNHFTVETYEEGAKYADMLIWRVFGENIGTRSNYSAYENTKVIDLAKNPQGTLTDYDTWGYYDESEDVVYLNSTRKWKQNGDSWRTIHEYFHYYASPDFYNALRDSKYNVPEEMIAENLGNIIARRLDPEGSYPHGPGMTTLLTAIPEAKLIDIFFNGNTQDMRDIVDSNTYDGAFCSFSYYLHNVNAYGHDSSPELENVFKDPSLKVNTRLCAL